VEDLERFELRRVGGTDELLAAQSAIRARTIREEVLAYITRLIRGTRGHMRVEVGARSRPG
jgi:hypothetical protein